MNKYGEAAVAAYHLCTSDRKLDPVTAWETAVKKAFPSSVSQQKKGCPRGAFLGLCETGEVSGINPGSYTRSRLNKGYAINAVAALRRDYSLKDKSGDLWKEVKSDVRHNHQLGRRIGTLECGIHRQVMSRKYVLYQTQMAFESKQAVGVFSREGLEAYVIKHKPDRNHLVLESGFFGKLKPIEEVVFLKSSLNRETCTPLENEGSSELEPKILADVSIRKLSESARAYLTQRVKSLSAMIAETRSTAIAVQARGDPVERIEFNKFLKEFPVEVMQKDFDSLLVFLSYHEAWTKSQESPVHWSGTVNTAANFFGQPVQGMVFLYCDTFYEVVGENSIEAGRDRLIKLNGESDSASRL